METKTEFKPGDIVALKSGEAFIETRKHEATIHAVEDHRVWLSLGHYHKWNSSDELKLVKRSNDTFIVGQKYRDLKGKDTMIVLAQSHADTKRFYIEYLNSPHMAGSVFLHDAHQWEIYKEPIKVVQYCNVYKGYAIASYNSRKEADENACKRSRIACKRVEFVEGEFDE